MPSSSRRRRKSQPQTDSRTPRVRIELEPRRRGEILVVLSLALATIVFLALVSYDPTDLSPRSESYFDDLNNLVGLPGAYLAWVLHTLFGHVSYIWPALFVYGATVGFGRPENGTQWVRVGSAVILVLSVCASLYLYNGPVNATEAVRAGGLFGAYFGELLLLFGPAGSLVVLVCLIALSLLLSTNFLFSEAARMSAKLARETVQIKVVEKDNEEIDDEPAPPPAPRKRSRFRRIDKNPEFDDTDDAIETVVMHHDPTQTPPEERIILSMEGRPPAFETMLGGEKRLLSLDDQDPASTAKRGKGKRKPKSEPVPNDSDELTLFSLDEGGNSGSGHDLIISTKMDETPVSIEDESLEAAEEPAEDSKATLVKNSPPPEGEREPFRLPTLGLLDPPPTGKTEILRDEIERTCHVLQSTFEEFGIDVRVVEVNYGPVITRYQIAPPPGVKLSKLTSLADNLAMNFKAESVRMEAPIPGKGTVGIEVPNHTRVAVMLSETLASDGFRHHKSRLRVALGKTIEGEPFVADLATMPHLLIAGATGAGKSVCINTIITSILFSNTPDEVKFLMVDPKRVELQLYAGIPHLLYPVITDPKLAGGALKWAVAEMEMRYDCLSRLGCRNLTAYNNKRKTQLEQIRATGEEEPESRRDLPEYMPYIVLIIDELADLMMVCRADVEASVQRLAQMARAVGIHLVLATQRPSVNVITGVIKANLPTRVAFQVSSKIDSRTILDENGAEALLGKGDMLFRLGGAAKPVRVQGAYVSTEEVEKVVEFICAQRPPDYQNIVIDIPDEEDGDDVAVDDDLYEDAVQVVLEHDAASTSLLQRRLKIGYGRAARLLDIMEAKGIVGPARGSKPREVLSSGVG